MKIHIVGAGDVGRYLANQLSDLKNDVVLIDISPSAIAHVEEKLDVMTAQGDATCRNLLKSAGVENSELFVAVTGTDGVNILSSALAAEMGARKTIARVDSPAFFLDQTGFERGLFSTTVLACAPRLVSYEMLRRFRSRNVIQVNDFAENALTLSAISVGNMNRDLTKDMGNSEKLMDKGLAGVVRDGEFFDVGEVGSLYESDIAVMLSPHEVYSKSVLGICNQNKSEFVVLIGGGDVGGELAKLLKQDGHRVTIIDIRREQCEVLAERFEKIQIVHGDGTNINTLEEEGVGDALCMFSVTKADEVNLMSSLLSKDLGVPMVYSLVHRPGYANVYEKLGVTATVSTHQLLYNTVDWMNSPAWVMRKIEFVSTRIEVAEVYIRPGADISNMNISNIPLPNSVKLLGGMINGKFVTGRSNPTLEDDGYYLFLGPTGFSKDLDKVLSKVKKA